LKEHGLDESGAYKGSDPEELTRVGVYFDQVDNQGSIRYVPRSVQIDLEQGVCNAIKSGPIGTLFRPDTYIFGQSGAGNNWAKGFYTEGAELVDSILDVLRKQAEGCDALQGFQFLQSLGGGTGSGLGSLLLSKVREEVPDAMAATFSIYPSANVSDTIVEPYNTLLTVHELVENSDLTVCIDNEALYSIAARLGNKSPQFSDLNQYIAQVLAGVSTSLRFSGQLNGDLRKIGMNLVPFPRLHFLAPSYAPLVPPQSKEFTGLSIPELTKSLFDRKNMLAAIDPRFGRYLTAATIYRGKIPSRDVEQAVNEIQTRNSSAFVEWIPDNISVTMCTVPPVGQKQAAICLANTTAIQEIFKRTQAQASAMLKRGAFMHRYTEEGMDPMEFTEAESNVIDLIAEYQQYQEAAVDEEDGEPVPPSEYEESVHEY
jgi:tubulin beta